MSSTLRHRSALSRSPLPLPSAVSETSTIENTAASATGASTLDSEIAALSDSTAVCPDQAQFTTGRFFSLLHGSQSETCTRDILSLLDGAFDYYRISNPASKSVFTPFGDDYRGPQTERERDRTQQRHEKIVAVILCELGPGSGGLPDNVFERRYYRLDYSRELLKDVKRHSHDIEVFIDNYSVLRELVYKKDPSEQLVSRSRYTDVAIFS